jgi:hypothetical protein
LTQDKEEVVLWMNTVGPYHNRQETYGYYTLPFCMGPKESIGKWWRWSSFQNIFVSVVDSKLFFFGFGYGFNLNFGSGFESGLFMKNTFELHII